MNTPRKLFSQESYFQAGQVVELRPNDGSMPVTMSYITSANPWHLFSCPRFDQLTWSKQTGGLITPVSLFDLAENIELPRSEWIIMEREGRHNAALSQGNKIRIVGIAFKKTKNWKHFFTWVNKFHSRPTGWQK